MSLKQFIAQENVMASFFKEPEIKIETLTQEQATKLFHRLDSNMSPEHLHADGERSPAAARKLATMYTNAFNELKTKGFTVPKDMYCLA